MVIDFDGNEYERIFFAPRYINTTTIQLEPNSDPILTINVNREKGFLRTYSVGVSKGVRQEWQQFQIETDGTFTKLISDVVPIFSRTLAGFSTGTYGTTI